MEIKVLNYVERRDQEVAKFNYIFDVLFVQHRILVSLRRAVYILQYLTRLTFLFHQLIVYVMLGWFWVNDFRPQ